MKTLKCCAAYPNLGVGHLNLDQARVARAMCPWRQAHVPGHLVILIMIVGIALGTVGLHASDNRMVGQFRVNLDPVHDWMQTRKGERPMPHWRNFSPLEYLGVINGGHAFRVAVARDGGSAPRLVVGIHGDGASRHLSRSDSTSFRGDVETKNP